MHAWKWKRFLWALVLVVGLLILAGCGADDTISTLKDRFAGEPDQEQVPQIEVVNPPPVENQETLDVTLYFSDPTGTELVPEERTIAKVTGIGRKTMEELIAGPMQGESQLLPTIPMGTRLLDINVRPDGLARVDFSKELVENHLGGSGAESLTVFSIVNTLAQFPTVDRVQILVEGQYVETLAGHVDVSTPLEANNTMVMAKGQS